MIKHETNDSQCWEKEKIEEKEIMQSDLKTYYG